MQFVSYIPGTLHHWIGTRKENEVAEGMVEGLQMG